MFLIQLIDPWSTIITDGTICQGDEVDLVLYGRHKRYALLTLLFARRGVLQPKHVTVFTANFMSPPTVGVAI